MTSRAPWLSHYDPGVPPTLAPYPSHTLLDFVSDAARTHTESTAVLFKGTALTYGELERLSDACAAAFDALGIRRGDRVALLLPNCPQFLIAELASWKIGAIAAPLNPTYTEAELEGPLREQGIETIVTLTRFYERIKRVQPKTPLTRVIATNIKEYFRRCFGSCSRSCASARKETASAWPRATMHCRRYWRPIGITPFRASPWRRRIPPCC